MTENTTPLEQRVARLRRRLRSEGRLLRSRGDRFAVVDARRDWLLFGGEQGALLDDVEAWAEA